MKSKLHRLFSVRCMCVRAYFRVRCCYDHWPKIKERNKHSNKCLLYPRLHTGYFTYIVLVLLQKIPQESCNCALVTMWKIKCGRKMRKCKVASKAGSFFKIPVRLCLHLLFPWLEWSLPRFCITSFISSSGSVQIPWGLHWGAHFLGRALGYPVPFFISRA